MRVDGDLLVIGVGNILLRDEGVGVRVVEAIADEAATAAGTLPERARIVDGGTLGLDLLPLIDDARALLFVDAVDAHVDPGTVVAIRGEALQGATGMEVSPHEVGVSGLISVARLTGTLPDHVALVGVQPADLGVGLVLSETVTAALPEAVRVARQLIRELDQQTLGPGGSSPGPGGSSPGPGGSPG